MSFTQEEQPTRRVRIVSVTAAAVITVGLAAGSWGIISTVQQAHAAEAAMKSAAPAYAAAGAYGTTLAALDTQSATQLDTAVQAAATQTHTYANQAAASARDAQQYVADSASYVVAANTAATASAVDASAADQAVATHDLGAASAAESDAQVQAANASAADQSAAANTAAVKAAQQAAAQKAAQQVTQPVTRQAATSNTTVAPTAPTAPVTCPAGSQAVTGNGGNDTSCLPTICFHITLPDPAHPECAVPFKP